MNERIGDRIIYKNINEQGIYTHAHFVVNQITQAAAIGCTYLVLL